MKSSNITMMFNGQTEAAFNFYKTVFGGEFTTLQRMKDIPGDHHHQMPAEEQEKILYVQLPVGNSVLMGMDIPSHMPPTSMGSNFMVTLDTSSKEETTETFNKLSEGGTIMMPLGDQFWGAFFGMATDKFGIQWMLSYVEEK